MVNVLTVLEIVLIEVSLVYYHEEVTFALMLPIVGLCLFSSRATLYVGKYSTSLYASLSLVHDGVTVVVSDGCM